VLGRLSRAYLRWQGVFGFAKLINHTKVTSESSFWHLWEMLRLRWER